MIRFPDITAQTTEQHLCQHWQEHLSEFWCSMQHGALQTTDGIALHYSYRLAPQRQQAVFISAGRMETAVKYTELMHDLYQAGYSVFIIDHRGQGESTRQLANRDKGYVSSFDHYSDDLDLFIQQVMLRYPHQRYLALGHSMGCAILCHYLARQPQSPFQAAVLSSPMMGIYTGVVPEQLAQQLTLGLAWINQKCSQDHWYFPGQGHYAERPFTDNPLTNSAIRYQWQQQLYRQYRHTRLGGVTLSWLQAAIYVMRQLPAHASRFNIPVLLLQAKADKVVSNHAQQRWFNNLPDNLYKKLVPLDNARHEIFMETDAIRNKALMAINHFLQSLPASH